MATEPSKRDIVASIDSGPALVLGGFVLALVGAVLPRVEANRVLFTQTNRLPLTGLDLIADALLFSPVPVLLLGGIAAASALGIEDQRARHVEAVLATLVVVLVLPYVFSPGFVFEGGTYIAGRSLVRTGPGVYVTIAGAIAMMVGAQVAHGK